MQAKPSTRSWDFPHRAFQVDIARLVEKPEVIARDLPRYAAWGYNTVFLYMEDAFRYPSFPRVRRPHSWSKAQLRDYVSEASRHGIRIINCLPLFGHSLWLTGPHRHLDEAREEGYSWGQICPRADRLFSSVDRLLADIAPYNTHPILHIGFDESPHIGKCRRCRPVLRRKGEGGILMEHLENMAERARRAGFTPGVWGDMFYYHPEYIPRIPKDIVIFDWFYLPFERWPRVEQFGFPEVDSAGRLRRAGLRVWGCPLGNGFGFGDFMPNWEERLKNIRDWARYGKEVGMEGQLVTAWEQRFGSRWHNAAIDAAATEFWKPGAMPVIGSALEWGLIRAHHARRPRDLAKRLISLGRHWVAGHYQRAHLYGKTVKEVVRYAELPDEVAALRDCGSMVGKLPPRFALLARTRAYMAGKSLAFNRVALARRTVRGAGFATLGREAGRLAREHKRLWRSYRYGDGTGSDQDTRSPLIQILEHDRDWLKKVAKGGGVDPMQPRMLCFRTHFFMPGIQSLAVTWERPDGKPVKLGRWFFVEFRDAYTRRGCRCVRSMAVALPDGGLDGGLRLEVFPYGPLGVGGLEIREGRRILPVDFRVVEKRGMVKRAKDSFSAGGGFCSIGDLDPVAQTHDLKRRARRHFLLVEMGAEGVPPPA